MFLGLAYDNFLLVANGHSVYRLDVSTETTSKLRIANETNFLPMTYYLINNTLYWRSDGHRAVVRSPLCGGPVDVVRSTREYRFTVSVQRRTLVCTM